MTNAVLHGLWAVLLAVAVPTPAQAAPACSPLLKHTLPRLQDEKPVDLCSFAGQVVLVVNTASQCGYTPQYKSLEALYQRYKDKGLVVLGFPSNDFGSQEPGKNTDIAEFCENQFAVRFPMFAKTNVSARSSKNVNPLYSALAARTGQPPKWNFHKYLVDKHGKVIAGYKSAVTPESDELKKAIDAALAGS